MKKEKEKEKEKKPEVKEEVHFHDKNFDFEILRDQEVLIINPSPVWNGKTGIARDIKLPNILVEIECSTGYNNLKDKMRVLIPSDSIIFKKKRLPRIEQQA